jgi:hypothetical protein
MGMHIGLVAIKAPVSEFRSIFPELWPEYEITASADNFDSDQAVWDWIEDHEHYVSSDEWTKENPGRQCLFFSQDGPWAIMMDPSYILASDQRALKLLSEQYGTALAFVVESASYCASFECYERGQLRRYIAMLEGDVKTEGEALPEEKGIDVNNYYMNETDYLMRAFGLSFPDTFPIPDATTAIEVTDRTDYSQFNQFIET